MAGKLSSGKAGAVSLRVAPHNSTAEKGVIACLMFAPAVVLPLVTPIVSGDMFFDPEFGKLFTVCCYLSQAGKPINNHLWLLGELPKHGVTMSESQLMLLATSAPSYSTATYFAEQVRDTHRLRKFATIAAKLADLAYESDATPEHIEGWLDGQVLSARHGHQDSDDLLHDVMTEVVNDLELRLTENRKPALLSGFPAADRNGFVFAPGELTVLAARTGMGKTTLATQIGLHHANKGRPILMASMEMRKAEVAARLLASAARLNHQEIRAGGYDATCITQMREAIADAGTVPFRLWSPGRVKVGQIHAMAQMRKATHNIELLIVDLLQCVKPDDPYDKEHVAFGKATKGLRDIAQHLQIPVILLAQLNRGADTEPPRLTHLKGSGEIEQDADVVAFLHSEQDRSEYVDLIIAKNRFGARGTSRLRFIATQTIFEDTSRGSEFNG